MLTRPTVLATAAIAVALTFLFLASPPSSGARLPDAVRQTGLSVTPVLFDKILKKDAPAPGTAQNIPLHPISDDKTFVEKTKNFHVMPFNDPDLEFEILLPGDWEADEMSMDQAPDLTKKILGDIARFRSPFIGTYQPVVTIQAQQLEHEISAKNWLRNHILTSGYSPEGDIAEMDDKRAAGAYITVEEGRSTHTYVAVQVNGQLAVLATFQVPLVMKDYIAYLQKKSIDSFRLVFIAEGTVEQQKTFTLVDAMKFSYPASWEIFAPDFKDMNKLSVQVHNRSASKILEGYIRCLAVRRSPDNTLLKAADSLKKDLADVLGIEFKSLLKEQKYDFSGRFLLSHMEIYDVGFKDGKRADQELRLLILGDREWYIFVYLVTPKEQDNLYVWARNIRSFDLMTGSIK